MVVKKTTTKRSKKQSKWEKAPSSIEVDGVPYEKVFKNTVQVNLELDQEALESIKKVAKTGLYASEAEIIRDALRAAIVLKKVDILPQQTVEDLTEDI
jgi:hypothetical protein